MTGTNKLLVLLNLEDECFEVGELVLSGTQIYFKYSPDFLKTGLNLSPFKLPFSGEIVRADPQPFDGLFGVFSDSLPDGWGRLLLDRSLQGKGINLAQVSPLDRLAYVGARGMGALSYKPALDEDEKFGNNIELDFWDAEMQNVLRGSSSQVIDDLRLLGGSSGGARPKIVVAYNPQSDEFVHSAHKIPNGYSEWLIKFPSSTDTAEIANIEFAYHKMALRAGVEMSDCQLFFGKSGRAFFGTKRFDRKAGKRLHMHTAAGLMHDNFRMSSMDYGHLMDCAFRLEKHVSAYEKVFRLAVFNVFAHNRDDHSKNFSFLMNEKGEWKFAPAYDLTFSTSGFCFHSTTVAGESKHPGQNDLMKLANHFGLKNALLVIEEVRDAIRCWTSIASDCGVSPSASSQIQSVLNDIV
jgi:serine/threonine-protein kinase HipA